MELIHDEKNGPDTSPKLQGSYSYYLGEYNKEEVVLFAIASWLFLLDRRKLKNENI